MRVTTAFNRLLGLEGISVLDVTFVGGTSVRVDVALRRRRLVCPLCSFSTRARYDTREMGSTWRHLDFGRWQVSVRAGLRRLDCPEHGVRVESVPFARPRSGFSRDFEDLVAYLATKTDKTTITRLCRVDWDTVGRICERVVADGLDADRLDGLVNIGVDEVSWRRHHHYLTLVADHDTKKIVWGAPGKDTATLDAFFDDLGPDRAAGIEAVSMDMGAAFNKSVRAEGHAPQAVICIDPFHAVGSSPTPWTWCAAPPGTNCVSYRTRTRPSGSRAPAGHCSNGPRISPRTSPRPCVSCAAAAATSGGPTASKKPSAPSSPATSTPKTPRRY